MARDLPSTLRYLAQNQAGVVSRSQALRAGLSPGMIKFRVRSGRWRQVHRGVYATFTGELTRRTRLWAAVLSAGPGAVLSHETAAELQRLADKPAEMIHLKDKTRDNAAAAEGKQSLRYGWTHVTQQPCATAAEVARVLRLHGWAGRPHPCSPGCPVQPGL